MSSESITNYLSVNKSLTSLGDGSRRLRLPRMNPFPKLDGRVVQRTCAAARSSTSQRAACGAVIIGGQAGSLPEMATDVIDPRANYTAENVKRDRSSASVWLGAGLGQLVDRMLGSHRAARP